MTSKKETDIPVEEDPTVLGGEQAGIEPSDTMQPSVRQKVFTERGAEYNLEIRRNNLNAR